MPNYRRDYSGNCWFFTVVTAGRRPILTYPQVRAALKVSVSQCRKRYPFQIDAWVLLPDHLHCIWRLPIKDRDYSRRWSLIKRVTSQSLENSITRDLWQKRFWGHRIDDDLDYQHHFNYVHFNPVKHRYAIQVKDWRWSTFHRYVRKGIYPSDWGGLVDIPSDVGRE